MPWAGGRGSDWQATLIGFVPMPNGIWSAGELLSDWRVLDEGVEEGVLPPALVALAGQAVVSDAANPISRVAAGVVPEQVMGEEQVAARAMTGTASRSGSGGSSHLEWR